MIKGNRGQWSELYTFVKVLADGKIYAADKDLNKKENLFYLVLRILRGSNLEFLRNDKIIIQKTDGEIISELNITELLEITPKLFVNIKQGNTGERAFAIDYAEELLSKLNISTLSDDIKETADIRIVIHDPITHHKPLLGFSIKSYIGSKPTLFNASKISNIIYKIHPQLSIKDIDMINSFNTYGKRFKWLQDNNYKLEYIKMNSDIFSSNLELIDSKMPNIVSEMVISKIFRNKIKISDISADLAKTNPCNYKLDLNASFYEYKIKRLLVDMALGMQAGKSWSGNFSATGGYIAVKQNGDLVCYHIYNWNDFQDYLFNHTKIDFPDSKPNRCDFGRVLSAVDVEEEKGTYIKINFQIRFC